MLVNRVEELLFKIQSSKGEERLSHIQKLQDIIWNDESIQKDILNDILGDIAYDLDFYEPNEKWRDENSSYYGDERLEEVLKIALRKLKGYKKSNSI